jgi:hypothetical protein
MLLLKILAVKNGGFVSFYAGFSMRILCIANNVVRNDVRRYARSVDTLLAGRYYICKRSYRCKNEALLP